MQSTIISVLSPNYSGSTLLSFLLATHPEIGTIGERKKFYQKVIRPNGKGSDYCSCGIRFMDCQFWSSVKREVLSRVPSHIISLDFSVFQFFQTKLINRLVRRMYLTYSVKRETEQLPYPFKARFKQICAANAILINSVLKVSNTTIFLDSSKSIEHTIFLSSLQTLKVIPIFLTRDGRAQVYSTLKRHKHMTIEEACESWVRKITQLDKYMNFWDTNYVLKYEHLCAEPDKTLRNIMDTLKIDFKQASTSFRDFDQHIMGNWEMRSGTSNQIHDNQEWRRKLTSRQLEIFEHIAGDTNRILGYS